MGIFSTWQPIYADYGIPTFPVVIADGAKRPAVKRYLRFRLSGSRELADRFPANDALGFGLRAASITVLDVDTPDERILADAMNRHGPTSIVVRSGSGHFQAWYRRRSEGRYIRPWVDLPIDVLGDGFVVAPPSKGTTGRYEFIKGSLDDIASLPHMRGQEGLQRGPRDASGPIPIGERNRALFRHCLAQAPFCDDLDALVDAARTFAEQFAAPLSDNDILKTAKSAWQYELRGDNWVGRGKIVCHTHDKIDGLMMTNSDAFILETKLRRHNWSGDFPVANAMANSMPDGGWTLKRLQAARAYLVGVGLLVCVRRASSGSAAIYRWP